MVCHKLSRNFSSDVKVTSSYSYDVFFTVVLDTTLRCISVSGLSFPVKFQQGRSRISKSHHQPRSSTCKQGFKRLLPSTCNQGFKRLLPSFTKLHLTFQVRHLTLSRISPSTSNLSHILYINLCFT